MINGRFTTGLGIKDSDSSCEMREIMDEPSIALGLYIYTHIYMHIYIQI
jgi:hypothetical protein